MNPSMQEVLRNIRTSADCLSCFSRVAVSADCDTARRERMVKAALTSISNLQAYSEDLKSLLAAMSSEVQP